MLSVLSSRIDDIEDGAKERRGQPCAYLVYGSALTINSANLAYFRALEQVLKLNSTAAVQSFTQECINLHIGQGMEIWFREQRKKPSVEEYFEIITNKTGGLFRLAAKLLGSADEQILSVASAFGELYQLVDDYTNLFGRDESRDDFADDLREGKFTLATIFGLETFEPVSSLTERIAIVNALRYNGAMLKCQQIVKDHYVSLLALIKTLPENQLFIELVNQVVNKVLS